MKTRQGFTLVEAIFAITILAIVALTLNRLFSSMSIAGTRTQDKAFASQKVNQMVEELRGLVTDPSTSMNVLDSYSDGSKCNFILTTKKDVLDPGHTTSGNGKKKFVRQVLLTPVSNDVTARNIFVRVYRAKTPGLAQAGDLLAEASVVLHASASETPPTQVFDLHPIAIENVPGWRTDISLMRPTFTSLLEDVQTRNRGLEFRTHWIQRLGTGRDPYYAPRINTAADSSNYNIYHWSVYLYPGFCQYSDGDYPHVSHQFFYYDPNLINGRARIGDILNGGTYSLADQFNNCVRYPDEVDPPGEMSLRTLIEKMNSAPETLRNILLVNLHGSLTPVPPLRNYSDPLRVGPNWNGISGTENWRVVSHPENLEYASGSAVTVRVYSYLQPTDMSSLNVLTAMPETNVPKVTVFFPGVSLNTYGTGNDFAVEYCTGSSTTNYTWTAATLGDRVSYTVLSSGTAVSLYNSPLRCPKANNNTGAFTGKRLYKLEYIPCPVGASFANGTKDLTTNNANVAKNTARWKINIRAGVLGNGRLTIETRLGNDLETGSANNQPTNRSRTFTWVGVNAPATEKFQFRGDPRYMPYADVKADDGYNWYFTDSFEQLNLYTGYGEATEGWKTDGGGAGGTGVAKYANFDVPRIMQIYREGALKTHAIWMSRSVFSFLGFGGEIASTPVHPVYVDSMFYGDGHEPVNLYDSAQNEISAVPVPGFGTGSENYGNQLIAGFDGTTNVQRWMSTPWLGELYPSGYFVQWTSTGVFQGNLPAYDGDGLSFHRARPTEAPMNYPFVSHSFPTWKGPSSFVNGNTFGNSSISFLAPQYGSSGDTTSTGREVAATFKISVPPTLASGSTDQRPHSLVDTRSTLEPDQWRRAPYNSSAMRTTLTNLETYVGANPTTRDCENNVTSNTNAFMAGLIKVDSNANNDAFYLLISGLNPTDTVGVNLISKMWLINALRGFMAAGYPLNATSRVPQLPLVAISSPTTMTAFANPTTITTTWTSVWKRWDGQSYTSSYPANFVDSSQVVTYIKYSSDGINWFFAQDNAATKAGETDAADGVPLFSSSHNATTGSVWSGSYSWNVANATQFPRGNYIIRVEQFRANQPLHYAYHQRTIFIDR